MCLILPMNFTKWVSDIRFWAFLQSSATASVGFTSEKATQQAPSLPLSCSYQIMTFVMVSPSFGYSDDEHWALYIFST